MLKTLSNLSLDTQAALNSLTRPSRRRAATARKWHDAPAETFSGSRIIDIALFSFMGIIFALFLIGGGQ